MPVVNTMGRNTQTVVRVEDTMAPATWRAPCTAARGGRNAAPAQAVNIFDDNDRVIHQHANAQPQAGQAENVQGNATEIHHDNGKQHTERHADGHHQRGADIL